MHNKQTSKHFRKTTTEYFSASNSAKIPATDSCYTCGYQSAEAVLQQCAFAALLRPSLQQSDYGECESSNGVNQIKERYKSVRCVFSSFLDE